MSRIPFIYRDWRELSIQSRPSLSSAGFCEKEKGMILRKYNLVMLLYNSEIQFTTPVNVAKFDLLMLFPVP